MLPGGERTTGRAASSAPSRHHRAALRLVGEGAATAAHEILAEEEEAARVGR